MASWLVPMGPSATSVPAARACETSQPAQAAASKMGTPARRDKERNMMASFQKVERDESEPHARIATNLQDTCAQQVTNPNTHLALRRILGTLFIGCMLTYIGCIQWLSHMRGRIFPLERTRG